MAVLNVAICAHFAYKFAQIEPLKEQITGLFAITNPSSIPSGGGGTMTSSRLALRYENGFTYTQCINPL